MDLHPTPLPADVAAARGRLFDALYNLGGPLSTTVVEMHAYDRAHPGQAIGTVQEVLGGLVASGLDERLVGRTAADLDAATAIVELVTRTLCEDIFAVDVDAMERSLSGHPRRPATRRRPGRRRR